MVYLLNFDFRDLSHLRLHFPDSILIVLIIIGYNWLLLIELLLWIWSWRVSFFRLGTHIDRYLIWGEEEKVVLLGLAYREPKDTFFDSKTIPLFKLDEDVPFYIRVITISLSLSLFLALSFSLSLSLFLSLSLSLSLSLYLSLSHSLSLSLFVSGEKGHIILLNLILTSLWRTKKTYGFKRARRGAKRANVIKLVYIRDLIWIFYCLMAMRRLS